MRIPQFAIVSGLFVVGASSAAEIIDPSVGRHAPGTAAVSVERDKHFGTNRLPALLYVDGKVVASVKGGEAIVIFLPRGPHVIGSTLSTKAGKPDQSIVVDAVEEKTTTLKAHLGDWGWAGMQMTRAE